MTYSRRRSTAARLVAAVVLGVLVSVPVTLVVALLTPSAASATTYRYWTYWWGVPGASGWKFASVGPASHAPADSWVLAWRFGTTTTNGSGGKAPRASHVYGDLCGSPTQEAGKVRVAVVVDYGTDADAPPGESPPDSGNVRVECVQVDSGSRGFTAMAQANLNIRQGTDGFVCGIDGYPRTECSAAVDPVPASSAPTALPSSAPPAAGAAPTATRSAAPAPSRSSTATATKPTASSSASRTAIPAASAAAPSRASAAPASTSSASPAATATPGLSAGPTSPTPTDTPPAEVIAESTLPARSGAPVAVGNAAAEPANAGNAMGFLGGALVVGGVGAAAWWTARRRGDAS